MTFPMSKKVLLENDQGTVLDKILKVIKVTNPADSTDIGTELPLFKSMVMMTMIDLLKRNINILQKKDKVYSLSGDIMLSSDEISLPHENSKIDFRLYSLKRLQFTTEFGVRVCFGKTFRS